jgi:ribosomal protein L35
MFEIVAKRHLLDKKQTKKRKGEKELSIVDVAQSEINKSIMIIS